MSFGLALSSPIPTEPPIRAIFAIKFRNRPPRTPGGHEYRYRLDRLFLSPKTIVQQNAPVEPPGLSHSILGSRSPTTAGKADDCFGERIWPDPFDWTGLNCSSASFLVGLFCCFSWSFYQWKVDNKPASKLIHNRPGPVRCENAWYRSVTSQQCAGPEKGDCG